MEMLTKYRHDDMFFSNGIRKALLIQRMAHQGQVYNGKPYWHHPVRVFLRLPASFSEGAKQAALLHDTLEDTFLTGLDLITLGFTPYTVDIVQKLSRDPDEVTYKDFIKGISDTKDVELISIKLSDLYENSNNMRFLPPEKRGRMVRYGKSIEDLLAALSNVCREKQIVFPDIISGELDKYEVEKWIGESPSFL